MDIMSFALSALAQYGLLGIFIVVMMEYACLPMPSEVLLPFAGMAASAANLPLALVVAVSVLGGLAGSALCYAIGAWGGRPTLERLLHRFPKALEMLDSTSVWQQNMGGLSIMTARVIPLFRTWISFAAGIARQPFGPFMLYSSVGILVWNTLLLLSGHYLLAASVAANVAGQLWLVPALALTAMLIIALVRKHVRKKRQQAVLGEGTGTSGVTTSGDVVP